MQNCLVLKHPKFYLGLLIAYNLMYFIEVGVGNVGLQSLSLALKTMISPLIRQNLNLLYWLRFFLMSNKHLVPIRFLGQFSNFSIFKIFCPFQTLPRIKSRFCMKNSKKLSWTMVTFLLRNNRYFSHLLIIQFLNPQC